MNTPLFFFCAMLAVFFGVLFYFFHEVLKSLPQMIADHARVYARAYAKATCLVLITSGAAFKEEFGALTAQQAAAFTWWGWAVLFWMPVAAGLGVIIAFLDTSVAVATAKKANEVVDGVPSPFPIPPPTPPAAPAPLP